MFGFLVSSQKKFPIPHATPMHLSRFWYCLLKLATPMQLLIQDVVKLFLGLSYFYVILTESYFFYLEYYLICLVKV